ncbi:MAG: hypothetical protein ACYSUQ_02330 [Planctomycetota bacterium]|jgi:nitrogen fixation-related uncharacterized protein
MIRRSESRTKRIALLCLAVVIVVPAGFGFINKLVEFFHTLTADQAGAFSIIPISNYLLATLGFACLLIWAVAQGMFRDIEGPKYTMLDREAELERRDSREGSR